MKEVTTLLITTTCLAIAGLGIYFFSSESNADGSNDEDNIQEGGKSSCTKEKRSLVKQKMDVDKKTTMMDNEIDNISENDSIIPYDDIFNIKNTKTNKNTKTKKSKNKSSLSRRKYY